MVTLQRNFVFLTKPPKQDPLKRCNCTKMMSSNTSRQFSIIWLLSRVISDTKLKKTRNILAHDKVAFMLKAGN